MSLLSIAKMKKVVGEEKSAIRILLHNRIEIDEKMLRLSMTAVMVVKGKIVEREIDEVEKALQEEKDLDLLLDQEEVILAAVIIQEREVGEVEAGIETMKIGIAHVLVLLLVVLKK